MDFEFNMHFDVKIVSKFNDNPIPGKIDIYKVAHIRLYSDS